MYSSVQLQLRGYASELKIQMSRKVYFFLWILG